MGKLIVITGAKGGCGKTTLTASLGLAFQRMRQSVCLVDGCVGLRGLDLLLRLQDQAVFDLNDLACEDCTMDQALLSTPWEHLYMIPAPQQRMPEGLGEKPLHRALFRLQKRFDTVLLDTPGALDPLTLNACGMADAAVLVTTPGDAAARNAEHASSLLRDATDAPVYLLMNFFEKARVINGQVPPPEALAAYLDLPLAGLVSLNEGVYAAAFARKRPDAYPEKTRQEIGEAAHRLCGEDIPFKPCNARRFPWHSSVND